MREPAAPPPEIGSLLARAEELEYGAEKMELVEEAVRRADELRDLDWSFRTRMELVQTATFSGYPERLMVAFGWVLGTFQRDPERFREHVHSLLWQFKYVLHAAFEFPQIERKRVDELFGQMAAMLAENGYNRRPLHYLRWLTAMNMGRRADVERFMEKWQAEPRDGMADCRACERDSQVGYHGYCENWEKTCEAAAPILDGWQSCAEVPHRTYGKVLRALLALGNPEKAEEYHREGVRRISRNPKFISSATRHIGYLLHLKETQRAAELVEEFLPYALATANLDARYRMFLVTERWLEQTAEAGEAVSIRLPGPLAEFREAEACAAWIRPRREELASQFDTRNGTEYYARGVPAELLY